jgi:hypothetical protein
MAVVDPDDRAKAIEVMRQTLVNGGLPPADAEKAAKRLVDQAIIMRGDTIPSGNQGAG